MKMKNLALAAMLSCTSIQAADLFYIDATSGGQSYYSGYNNLDDLINGIGTTSSIQAYFPTYTDTTPVNLSVGYRGLPINFSYANNDATLNFNIPSLGITKTFTGATREESQILFEDWIEKNGGTLVERMMKELAAVSPQDPVAGNPASLMSQSVDASFSQGFSTSKATTTSLSASYLSIEDGSGIKTTKYSIPLSYTIESEENQDKKITFLMPLGLTDVEGAKAYDLGLGISVSIPITDSWTLTPTALYGMTGSIDMGSLGQVMTGSLVSSYEIDMSHGTLGIGNMIGYSQTVKFYDSEYAYDPGIRNTVFKNGLSYAFDLDGMAKGANLNLFAVNTMYTGTDLYMDSYNEFGFSFGLTETKKTSLESETVQVVSDLRLGLTYLDSDKSDGFKVNFGYKF
jgi:hypothetical protein